MRIMTTRYRNKFNPGDILVCHHSYAYIGRGDTVRVTSITPTGSVKLDGIAGSYNPDNFSLKKSQVPLSDKLAGIDKKVEYFVIDTADDGEPLFDEVVGEEELAEYIRAFIRDIGVENIDMLHIFKESDRVDVTPYLEEVQKPRNESFYLVGFRKKGGAKCYAKLDYGSYMNELTFGRPGTSFNNHEVIPFTKDEADEMTLQTALAVMARFKKKFAEGQLWIRDLALEPVNS